MKPLLEQSHYEVLEVSADASLGAIERAFQILQAAFSKDSVATYSLYAPEEAEAIRQRLELAYHVLSDDEARGRYDAEFGGEGASSRGDTLEGAGEEGEEDRHVLDPDPGQESLDKFELIPGDSGEPLDGSQLRRWRLQRGVEIEDIAEATKVSPAYLRGIEEECFAELPAGVYVRGFLAAYARYLQLSPERVVSDYMERFERGRELAAGGRRQWLRSRRS